MNETPKTPALREYDVWADSRYFQRVEASSPQEAYRIAQEHPDNFEPCCHGIENFELLPDVLDIETGEEFMVGPLDTHGKMELLLAACKAAQLRLLECDGENSDDELTCPHCILMDAITTAEAN